jgi:hypothetical protein
VGLVSKGCAGFDLAGVVNLKELLMGWTTSRVLVAALSAIGGVASISLATQCCVNSSSARPSQQPAAQSPTGRQVGTIKAIRGNTITLATDAGAEINAIVQDSTPMVRVEPGQKDLKGATSIQLKDLQVGDRILVRGQPSDNAKSIAAAGIIVMKHSDVQAKQERDREDWQKRGIGGLVSAVDPSTGTVTVSVASPGGNKTIAIHAARDTILRRYAPDSVQFDDAKPAPLDEIKPGDQLRARGTRSADGSEFAAEEIVTGAFRNIAGTISSIDTAANTIAVTDQITKKPVLVRVTAQSQLRKLPPEIAQRIAFRLKGGAAGAPAGAAPGGSGVGASGMGARPEYARRGGSEQLPGGMDGNARPVGQADLQEILSRVPAATFADLQKGDAVMIVSTEGTSSSTVTAITLLAGVEPILAAAPRGAQATTLSPWNLGLAGGEGSEANP